MQKNNLTPQNKLQPHHFYWPAFALFLLAASGYLAYEINLAGKDQANNFDVAHAAAGVNLSLSPTSSVVALNQNFNVNINMTTAGTPTDGVDIYSLRFNPAILQVVDSVAGTAGIQIAPGSLLPSTVINTVNNSTGTIQFSQAASGGSNFNGSGILATITFRGNAAGASNVTFDFSLNSTADTNVAYQGVDQLESVTNASFTVDNSAPTTPTALNATATSTSQINLSWTASTDNVAVTGYKIFRGGTQINTSATNSYSDTGLTGGTLYSYTVSAYDGAGNNSAQSSAASATTQSGFDFSLANGGNKSVAQGSSTTNSVTATLTTGSAQAVSFSASGQPTGATVSFAPTSCNPTCTSTMTINTIGTTPVSTSTITVTGTAGSLTHTTTFSLTVTASTFQRTISVASLDGRSTKVVSGTLDVLNVSKVLLKSYAYTTDASGNATITFDIAAQTAYLKVKASPFLTRMISQDLNINTAYSFPQLLIGDINQDNIINSIDYSTLNTNWFTSATAGDLNLDGLVNSIDYSFMNKHWLVTGEQ